MNIKMNTVAIVVLSSLSAGMSSAYAGFNETPYVSYLSDGDFDVAFPVQQQVALLKPSDSRAVVRVADTSKNTVNEKKNVDPKVNEEMTAQAVKIEQSKIAKPTTEAPAPSEDMQIKSPTVPGCPANEIGYIAPCL